MESLERLRRYVNEHTNTDWEYATFPPQRQLVNCTDTAVYALIDAIENEVVNMRNLVWNEGYDMGFTSADKLAVDREDKLSEHGWVRLPVDADGEPWHINDEFETDEGIAHVNGIGDNRLFYIDNDGMQWTRADNKLHHHKPTVEDVLEELLREYDRDDSELTNGEIIERFAAKLRLAGDGE